MGDQEGTAVDLHAVIRTILSEAGIQVAADPLETVRSMAQEHHTLTKRAAIGDRYWEIITEDVIKAGIAGMGERFDETAQKEHRDILATYPRDATGVRMAETMRDAFARMAGDRFQPGRHTTDTTNDPPGTNGKVDKAPPVDLHTYR